MNWGRIMAVLMASESAIAMVYYATKGDWRMFWYWLGCVVVYVALAK